MKKTILLLILILCIFTDLKAQPKGDTTKKVEPPHPSYQFDGTKQINFGISVTFTLKAGDVQNYLFTLNQGGIDAIENGDLPGKTRAALKSSFNTVVATLNPTLDSLNNHLLKAYLQFILSEKAKFRVDSLKMWGGKR